MRNPRLSVLSGVLGWLLLLALIVLLSVGCGGDGPEPGKTKAWWDSQWTGRMRVTVDPSAGGEALSGKVPSTTALVRLHAGNFDFAGAKPDGSDLRFVSLDNESLLPHRIERYDELIAEAFVWVRLPERGATGALEFWLYHGNPVAEPVADSGVYGEENALVFHFAEATRGGAEQGGVTPVDSVHGTAVGGGGLPVESALVGPGARLNVIHSVEIPGSENWDWKSGEPMAFSIWVAPEGTDSHAVVLRRGTGEARMELGIERGIPFLEVAGGGDGGGRITAGEAVQESGWTHLAIAANGTSVTLWVQGRLQGSLEGGLPSMSGPLELAPMVDGQAFTGRVDEFRIVRSAWAGADVQFAYLNQGADARSQRLVSLAPDQEAAAPSPTGNGFALFRVIVDTLNWDGWTIIGILLAMALASLLVIVMKAIHLRAVERANLAFTELWNRIGDDLGVFASDEEILEEARRIGHSIDPRMIHHAPLYHLYRTGWAQVSRRLTEGKDGSRKISALAVQAVRASVYAASTREVDRLHSNLVFLTFSISGAPFLGLLGTVVGVAVTFASIALAGEVAVETIAPGVAGALATTIVGLCVAIPALFGYNYLLAPIKRMTTQMRVFTDEFVTRVAEAYSSRKSLKKVELASTPVVAPKSGVAAAEAAARSAVTVK